MGGMGSHNKMILTQKYVSFDSEVSEYFVLNCAMQKM